MPSPSDINLASANDKPVERGNVCINEKGQLFVALNLYRMPQAGGVPTTWYGIGFNGEHIYAENCFLVANNINEYLQNTYGNDYSQELAQATEQSS